MNSGIKTPTYILLSTNILLELYKKLSKSFKLYVSLEPSQVYSRDLHIRNAY